MNNHIKSVIAALSFVAILTGCWKQQDVVSIKSDGITTFQTEVVITEKGFSVRDIDELTSAFMKGLISAGWQVERKWVSKSEPFKLTFSGHGNIRQVKSATDFYRIEKLNGSTYNINFRPAVAKGGKSSRSIKFERGFFGGGAKILDARGNEVNIIQNVLGGETYKIIF